MPSSSTHTRLWCWYHSNYPNEWILLSQIRGSVVVLRDRIHKELGHTIDLNQFMIKLGKQSKSIKNRGEQGSCSVDWLIGWGCKQLLEIS